MMRTVLLALALLSTSAVAQHGTFRRREANDGVLPAAARKGFASWTSDNCTGAAQSISGGVGAVTWTRATTATCTNNSGTLVQVASGQPRCNSTGCLVEKTATNSLLWNTDFSNAVWSKTTVTPSYGDATCGNSPDGTTSGTVRAVPTGADSVINQLFTVTNGTTYTVSVWVKKASDNVSSPSINLYIVAPGNTNITFSPTSSWVRYSVTATATANATGNVILGGGSSFTAADGPLCFWGAQAENSAAATSYIPTTSATVTRNADIVTYAQPRWLTSKQGCASATVTLATSSLINPNAYVFGFTGNLTPLYLSTATAVGMYDGTNQPTRTVTSLIGRSAVLRGTWNTSGSTMSLYDAGALLGAASTYSGTMVGATGYLGSVGASANTINGYLSNITLGGSPARCP